MIPAGLKAGTFAFHMLKTLYKGKKAIRTGADVSSKWIAKKGFGETAQVASGMGKKITKASRWTGKKIKKYPKTASAIGGAPARDLLDKD